MLSYIYEQIICKNTNLARNVLFQHRFVCFDSSQRSSPTREMSLTYHSSEIGLIHAHNYLVDTQQLLCLISKIEYFGERKPFIGKKWRKGKLTHRPFQFLLSQSLLVACPLNRWRQRCQTSPRISQWKRHICSVIWIFHTKRLHLVIKTGSLEVCMCVLGGCFPLLTDETVSH